MDPNQTLEWSETLKQPLHEARHAFGEVSKEARQAIGEVGQAISPLRDSLERSIVANPLRAVVVSLVAGVFIGWLIKRS